MMLMQLYFSDNKGALISSGCFCIISSVVTYITSDWGIKYYGIGFLAGSVVFAIVSMFLLWGYIRKIMFHVLSNQPLLYEEKVGIMGKISARFEKRYDRKISVINKTMSQEDKNV